jgi:hypothetical protein
MGVAFTEVTPEQQAKLDHWLNNLRRSFKQSAREQQFEPGTT